MFSYTAYGLGICSDLLLPEFIASDTPPDVLIRRGTVEDAEYEAAPIEETVEGYFRLTPDRAFLAWPEVGKFLVTNGSEVIIDPVPGAEESLIRLPLLGAVLAVLMHQRGYFVLHASAVAINGEVVTFLGNKGDGKSTLAATLYEQGHTLMSDDVVAIDLSVETPRVIPGFPQFKLWPDAVASLGQDPATLPQLTSGYEKLAHRVRDRFWQDPLPLKRIYLLASGEAMAIKPLSPQEMIRGLISHSYMARFGSQILHGKGASSHLLQCTQLATKIPVRSLERPRSLALLPDMVRLIEADLAPTLCYAEV